MGGNGHVPLPLTYDNPELFNRYKNNQKTIFCSFIGSITHHCRQIMIDNFKSNQEYFQKYLDNNKYLHGKSEAIRYDSQSVTYDFEKLQKKFDEIVKICS